MMNEIHISKAVQKNSAIAPDGYRRLFGMSLIQEVLTIFHGRHGFILEETVMDKCGQVRGKDVRKLTSFFYAIGTALLHKDPGNAHSYVCLHGGKAVQERVGRKNCCRETDALKKGVIICQQSMSAI